MLFEVGVLKHQREYVKLLRGNKVVDRLRPRLLEMQSFVDALWLQLLGFDLFRQYSQSHVAIRETLLDGQLEELCLQLFDTGLNDKACAQQLHSLHVNVWLPRQ